MKNSKVKSLVGAKLQANMFTISALLFLALNFFTAFKLKGMFSYYFFI